jgi:hypothetical protein
MDFCTENNEDDVLESRRDVSDSGNEGGRGRLTCRQGEGTMMELDEQRGIMGLEGSRFAVKGFHRCHRAAYQLRFALSQLLFLHFHLKFSFPTKTSSCSKSVGFFAS